MKQYEYTYLSVSVSFPMPKKLMGADIQRAVGSPVLIYRTNINIDKDMKCRKFYG